MKNFTPLHSVKQPLFLLVFTLIAFFAQAGNGKGLATRLPGNGFLRPQPAPSMYSSTAKRRPVKDSVYLSGYLDKAAQANLQSVELIYNNLLFGKTEIKSIPIAHDGLFKASIYCPLPCTNASIRFGDNSQYLVLCPGDTVTVAVTSRQDAKQPGRIDVLLGGTLGAINNEYNAATQYMLQFDDFKREAAMIRTINQDDYRQYVIARQKTEDSLLALYAVKHPLSNPVKEILQYSSHYKVPNSIMRYAWRHAAPDWETLNAANLHFIQSFVTKDERAYLGGYQFEGFAHELVNQVSVKYFGDTEKLDSVMVADYSFQAALAFVKKYDPSLTNEDRAMLDTLITWAPLVKKNGRSFTFNVTLKDSTALQALQLKMAFLQKMEKTNDFLGYYKATLEMAYKLKMLTREYEKGYLRDHLVGHFIQAQVFSSNRLFLDDVLLHTIKELLHDPAMYSIIESENKEFEQQLRAINQEDLLEEDPDEETVLNRIARQYAGKVVYIDLWATWCAPCIEQFAYSKKIKDTLAGKPLVFAYLCAESSAEAWTKAIKKHQLKGEHILLTDEEILTLRSKYGFSGFPHYMIINSRGKLESSNARRPQAGPALIAALEKLLP